MKKLLIAAVLFFQFSTGKAQQDDSLFIRRLATEILVNGRSYEDLRVLTKTIGARLAGSPQMVKAEQWGLRTMQLLSPDKAWLQACQVPHWVRGGTDAVQISYGKSSRSIDVLALGNSAGTPAGGVRAPVLMVNSFEDLAKKKDSVKGKIVFFNYPFDPTYVRTFESYRDAVRYRGQGPSEAAKLGAVGVLVRSMSHSTDNHPHTGSTRYDSTYPLIPAVAVGLKDADWLAQAAGKGTPLSAFVRTYGKFLPDTTGHNVIAEIRGSEFPDQYITIGGHLDSWDVGEGAHDDGAGCVQTIEILRAFRALNYKPKHTIRFVLFANEENGLRGGTAYADEAKAKGEKHIFALESDAGGFTPRGFGVSATDNQYAKIAAWQPLLAPYGATEITKGGGGADIGPLARTQSTPVAGLSPDSQRYFDLHHARNDVFEAVNKRELQLGAVNMAALVYLVDKYGL